MTANKARLKHANELATSLIDDGHSDTAAIKARRSSLNGAWDELEEAAVHRAEALKVCLLLNTRCIANASRTRKKFTPFPEMSKRPKLGSMRSKRWWTLMMWGVISHLRLLSSVTTRCTSRNIYLFIFDSMRFRCSRLTWRLWKVKLIQSKLLPNI